MNKNRRKERTITIERVTLTTTRTVPRWQRLFCNVCGCEVEASVHAANIEQCSTDVGAQQGAGEQSGESAADEIKTIGEEK